MPILRGPGPRGSTVGHGGGGLEGLEAGGLFRKEGSTNSQSHAKLNRVEAGLEIVGQV